MKTYARYEAERRKLLRTNFVNALWSTKYDVFKKTIHIVCGPFLLCLFTGVFAVSFLDAVENT